jgi:glyoxylase-like metal-dependent hydrolase (beta-lactamase superfamily II)
MQIGNYALYAIETGRFRLDGGAMFGSVPKVIWQKSCKADDLNRIELASRVLLLVSKSKRVLVDTGLGTKLNDKETRIFGYDNRGEALLTQLDRLGLKASDITDVILTHLHFDHAGGATTASGESSVLTFPKARYYVQRGQWEQALRPTDKDRAGFKPIDFRPLLDAGLLEFVDGEMDFFENISLKVVHGHTPSLQLPLISDGHKTLLFCGDLIPTSAHLKPHYIMGFDLFPLTTLKEKQLLLNRAAAEKWLLFLQHDPAVTYGVARMEGAEFVWAEQSYEF